MMPNGCFRWEWESAPGGTRTPDPLLRRQLLYPPELQTLRAASGDIAPELFQDIEADRKLHQDSQLELPI